MKCNLERLHPLTTLVYFFSTALIVMISGNPFVSAFAYLSSLTLNALVFGGRKLIKSLASSLPLMVIIALVNPLFVHKGESVLFFMNGNAITTEAILYGAHSALMLMAIFYFFKVFSEIMTDDKTVYLFGKLSPRAALLLSSAIGLIPRMKRRFEEIESAQKALGIYTGKGITDKVRGKFRVFSILVSDALEGSADRADSMKARGYSLEGRSFYSKYRFFADDIIILSLSIVLSIVLVAIQASGKALFVFYPVITFMGESAFHGVYYGCAALLLVISLFFEIKEILLWKHLKSKI